LASRIRERQRYRAAGFLSETVENAHTPVDYRYDDFKREKTHAIVVIQKQPAIVFFSLIGIHGLLYFSSPIDRRTPQSQPRGGMRSAVEGSKHRGSLKHRPSGG
jgi:hypothetical protein